MIPVVIVGGGPIGLALAADLGRRGIRTMLVEKRRDAPTPAKMIEVGVRTAEFCRHSASPKSCGRGAIRSRTRSTASS